MIPASPGLFIAGTDTGVGKTVVAVSIVRALIARGLAVAAMKPIAAGATETSDGWRNEDGRALAAATNVTAPYEVINPYCLPAPVSPHIAAAEAGVRIECSLIERRFRELGARADCVIVEGAGGWLAPIAEHESLADVARRLALPVVLVIGLRLGCLNHALLTARAIETEGLPLAGWIGNRIDSGFERLDANLATLTQCLGQPPLAVIAPRERAAPELEPGIPLPDTAIEPLLARLRGGAAHRL